VDLAMAATMTFFLALFLVSAPVISLRVLVGLATVMAASIVMALVLSILHSPAGSGH
jgi:hypothetical protein